MTRAVKKKPYRKHLWEYIPAWPSQYLPGQAAGMPHFAAYERCRTCCVTRTPKTEDAWCGNPRDEQFEPFPYPPPEYEYDPPGR